MLSNYSWTDFVVVVLVASAVFYAYVILRYYRKEVVHFVSKKGHGEGKLVARHGGRFAEEAEEDSQYPDPGRDMGAGNAFSDVESLMNEVKEYVAVVEKRQVSGEEILSGVSSILKRYSAISEPVLRASINEYMQKMFENKGVAMLSEEDVEALWGDTGASSGESPR